jgi:indolepyruvate ferredoxin oxidoreductase alpha subunit
MAERSFKKEVEQLLVPAGTVFRGEGILAVTKALLECGVGYVAGYQGAPISHLMDVLADARPILDQMGVHFESSASEACAAATLAPSMTYPIRGAVTWKSTVGTNVASDALANLASGGVIGGALIIIGEDYGEGSSIMQERTHAFAMKSQIWLLDPRPNLPSIVNAVHHGFALSEASNTPVMLELRIRACHVHGSFVTRENRPPAFNLRQALEAPRRDTSRIVLPPAAFMHEHEKVLDRWPAAVKYIQDNQLNEFFDGDIGELGVIVLGGLYNNTLRALMHEELADLYGQSRIPMYVLNVAYPIIDAEVLRFCEGKKAVLIVEEGQPDYHEQAIRAVLSRAGLGTTVHGKDLLTMAGEYTVAELRSGVKAFASRYRPAAVAPAVPISIKRERPPSAAAAAGANMRRAAPELNDIIPARPPSFCTGCPERPIFSALTLLQQDLGEHHIAGDIGCHLFAAMPPFHLGASTMGYGLGASSAAAFGIEGSKRAISIMGDGGFWHNGLTSGIANAVFNKSDGVIVIVDNNYSAATGGQDIPSSRADNPNRSTYHPIEAAVRGVGVQWVRTITDTYDVRTMRDALKEALTTDFRGPKVVIAQSECMLNRQRRERPQKAQAAARGERVLKEKFGVDAAVCSGDHACMRVSGCPSLSLKPSGDPLKPDPVAAVDDSCVACGHCGEVADAAVLCPSFYRIEWVRNASAFERGVDRVRRGVAGWLQTRRNRSLAARSLEAETTR